MWRNKAWTLLNEEIRLVVQQEIESYKLLLISKIENSQVHQATQQEITYIRVILNKFKLELALSALKKNVISSIKRIEKEDDCYELIPFLNGVYNLRTNTLSPYTPTTYIINKLNMQYYYNFDTKQIFNFCRSWFNSDEETKFVLQLVYNILRGSTERKAYFCVGGGYNGKSFFSQLLKDSFGNLVKTIPGTFFANPDIDSDKPNPQVCKLINTRIGIIEEPPRNKPIITEIFKKFIGNDSITTRYIKENEVLDFTNKTRFFFFGNYVSEFTALDTPLLERLEINSFSVSQKHVKNEFIHD